MTDKGTSKLLSNFSQNESMGVGKIGANKKQEDDFEFVDYRGTLMGTMQPES